jgi:hypothetical protein
MYGKPPYVLAELDELGRRPCVFSVGFAAMVT